jgi:integrase
MSISKSSVGWLVDVQPGGRGGRRFRKTLPTKAEALTYEAWLKTKITQSPEWHPPRQDARRLLDLVELWFRHHGINLRAGENTYSRLKHLCTALGNPIAEQFQPEMFADYRAKRMTDGISANNLNREHSYLRAVFNELERLGHWKGGNPLIKVRQMKIAERELSFLSIGQIRLLLDALSGDAQLIAKICLATGARWSEAEGLRVKQVRNGQIQFTGTKSGKNRSVPIDDALIAELDEHHEQRYGDDSAIAEQYFRFGYAAFRDGVERAGLTLPRGQLTHVLRHTFASHFIMNGGNILVLQKILGHSSLTMTMRYAHLAPEHLQEARTLNPLSRLAVR